MLRLLEKVLKMEKGMKDGWLKVINLLLLQAEHDVIIKLQSCKEINFSLDNDFSIRTFLWGVWMNNLAKQPPLQNDLWADFDSACLTEAATYLYCALKEFIGGTLIWQKQTTALCNTVSHSNNKTTWQISDNKLFRT